MDPSLGISPIPVHRVALQETAPLNAFFEKIIDKKINKVALNIFERLIDVLCSCFYTSYKQRLADRLSELDVADEDSPPQAVAQKVLHFMDGAPLYDRTTTQRVDIQQNLITALAERGEIEFPLPRYQHTILKMDSMDNIVIDGKPVWFNNLNHMLLFGANFGTQEVIVTDVKECPELVIIYERETSGQLKAWSVDTTQPVKKSIMGGQPVLETVEGWLATPITTQSPPQNIAVDFIDLNII